jgi:hypothetical protein
VPLFRRQHRFDKEVELMRVAAFSRLLHLERERKAKRVSFEDFASQYVQVTEVYPIEDPAASGTFGPETGVVHRFIAALSSLSPEQWKGLARSAQAWRANRSNLLRTGPIGLEVVTPGAMRRARVGIGMEIDTTCRDIAGRAGQQGDAIMEALGMASSALLHRDWLEQEHFRLLWESSQLEHFAPLQRLLMLRDEPSLSPDGRWWWTGSQWVSARSADGQWQWDGRSWQPASDR